MKKRIVDVLHRLLVTDYPLSIEQLAEETAASGRTIRNDLNEINTFLADLHIGPIQTLRGKGILLKLTSKQQAIVWQALHAQQSEYMTREERRFDLLLHLTFSKEILVLNKKEEAYQISKSSMDEDMRRLRADINKYGIEIISLGKKGLRLNGSERAIRTMIFDIINQRIGRLPLDKQTPDLVFTKLLYRYLPQKEIKQIQLVMQAVLPPNQNELYSSQILLFTAIWLMRIRMKEFITRMNWSTSSNQLQGSAYIQAIVETFSIQPPEIEVNYLSFIIESLNFKDLSNSIEWAHAQLLSLQLIQFVECQTKIPFSKKEEELLEGLYKHMAALIVRAKSGIQVPNPIKETVRKNYGQIYQAVKGFAPTIEEIVGQPLSEDELTFLVIHFSTALSSLNHELITSYKAVVVCNHGMATGNLLAASLKEKFPEVEVAAVLNSQEVNLITKFDVDLVFSTYEIDYREKPVLLIPPIINEENHQVIRRFLNNNEQFKRIAFDQKNATLFFNQLLTVIEESGGTVDAAAYRKLTHLFEQNQLAINAREIQPMLKDVLSANHIQLNVPVQNWEEAIERSAQPLVKEQIIEKHYIEAMVAAVKEYGPYIVIGKHLALAHARPEDGAQQLGVSVLTLAPPVAFGNPEMDPVKIIFCLAAVDSYSHLAIMKELIELINDEKKVTQLLACSTIEAFQSLLFS